jgi:hypothetical protein
MTAILHHAALIYATGMAALLAITLKLDRLLRNGSSAPAEDWRRNERTPPSDPLMHGLRVRPRQAIGKSMW